MCSLAKLTKLRVTSCGWCWCLPDQNDVKGPAVWVQLRSVRRYFIPGPRSLPILLFFAVCPPKMHGKGMIVFQWKDMCHEHKLSIHCFQWKPLPHHDLWTLYQICPCWHCGGNVSAFLGLHLPLANYVGSWGVAKQSQLLKTDICTGICRNLWPLRSPARSPARSFLTAYDLPRLRPRDCQFVELLIEIFRQKTRFVSIFAV